MIKIGDEVEASVSIKVSTLTEKLVWGHTQMGDYVCVPVNSVIKKEDELYTPEPRIYGGV